MTITTAVLLGHIAQAMVREHGAEIHRLPDSLLTPGAEAGIIVRIPAEGTWRIEVTDHTDEEA